jgi:prephenate dehydrogenase
MIKNPVIGIIGGTGIMGGIFEKFFTERGFKVLTASRKTKLSIEQCAKTSDVVIVSVPIDKTLEIIKKVGPVVKKTGLLMDLTSLKKEPVKVMLENSVSSVVGMHPMFGDGVRDLKNQIIVVCPARGKEWFEWIKKILVKAKAIVKISTPEAHDQMMAIVQGLTHFTSMTMIDSLKTINFDVKESMEYSNPAYKLKMLLSGRILNQNPQLYAGIEIQNPDMPKVLKTYINSVKKLYRIIKNKKYKDFIKYFDDASDYLGDFKETARNQSNKIIKYIN